RLLADKAGRQPPLLFDKEGTADGDRYVPQKKKRKTKKRAKRIPLDVVASDSKLLHFSLKVCPFQAKTFGRAVRSSEDASGFAKNLQNMLALRVFEGASALGCRRRRDIE